MTPFEAASAELERRQEVSILRAEAAFLRDAASAVERLGAGRDPRRRASRLRWLAGRRETQAKEMEDAAD